MQKRKEKNNVGITLVALIITIIVLLILAGVIFSSLLGDGGILRRTSDAGNISKKASENEENALVYYQEEIDKRLGTGGKGADEDSPGNDLPAGDPAEKPGNWENEHVSAIADGEGGVIPLPEEFEYSKGDLSEGIVIIDGNNNEFVWIPVPDITEIAAKRDDGINWRGRLYDFGSSASPKIPPVEYDATQFQEPSVIDRYSI